MNTKIKKIIQENRSNHRNKMHKLTSRLNELILHPKSAREQYNRKYESESVQAEKRVILRRVDP